MLNLNNALKDLRLTRKWLAESLGLSRTAVSAICNHGQWPASPEKEVLKQCITALLEGKGASAATLAALYETTPDTNGTQKREDLDMLLRKQPLFPDTKKHFGIFADPFGELTDAAQVYDTPEVRYVRLALAQTLTSERFIAVCGESGAGKSTLRRDLIDRINRETLPVTIIEPYVLGLEDNDKKGKTLKSTDIAAAIIRTVDPQAKLRLSAESRYAQLHNVLRESRRAGNRHVLIIEEAHGLSIPTLKHLKRFYELEDGFNRLLSIVLIGQTELAEKLAENRSEVREVVQRIELITLDPLDNHLEGYLTHRLAAAGKQLGDIMDQGAIDALRNKLTVPSRQRGGKNISLLYPLAVGNQLIAAMNKAAEFGAPKVTADVIKAV
ncbi:ExeA family protein [Thalassolituus oleivorans]|uniref:ExeA family protein n=1 Tax=Thalassolituus oleivorans TaxID=187493 RepID=UPI0023F48549|nr:AAA family ATPase [Thalassolituus oleivorans]